MMDRRIDRPRPADRRDGFTALVLCIIIVVASMWWMSHQLGDGAGDTLQKSADTVTKLAKVEERMVGFMAKNGRRPCPADGQYDINTANFGVEAANPGTCTIGAGMLGPDAGTGYIVGGVIPTKTLGLDDSYAFDQFGHRITYVVDLRATLHTSCVDMESPNPSLTTAFTGKGGLVIENTTGGTVLDHTMYAYISHGPDGHGAFPAQGSTVAGRINTGSTDVDKLTNAGVNAAFLYNTTNFTNARVMKGPTSTFGDIVYYADYLKNTCCVGTTNCFNYGFRADGMVAGNGYSGVNGVFTGDVNGDGIPDLIIGGYDGWYVVFGTATGFPNPLPLNSLNGSNGFKIIAPYVGGNTYNSVIGVGDVNGDGYADIVLDPYDYGGAGMFDIYVLFGHANPWPATINTVVTGQADGTNGIVLTTPGVIYGAANGDSGGEGVGDINGDGLADLMIYDNTNHRYYFYFGQKCGGASSGYAACPASIDPHVAADGTHGFYLKDDTGGAYESTPVFADVNGDGVQDLLFAVCQVEIIFGNKDAGHTYWAGLNGANFTSLMDGTHGASLYVSNCIYPAAVGDLIGDGHKELILDDNGQDWGNYTSMWPVAIAYIVPLNGFSWGSPSYNINTLISGGQAFWIGSDSSSSTFGAAKIADVNGDGINDLILPCPSCTRDSPYGSVYVIYGTGGALHNIDLNVTPLNGSNGFRIDCSYAPDAGYCGGALSWGQLATADLNGDGIADIIINSLAGTTAAGANSGYTYVLYGSRKPLYFASPFPLSNIQ